MQSKTKATAPRSKADEVIQLLSEISEGTETTPFSVRMKKSSIEKFQILADLIGHSGNAFAEKAIEGAIDMILAPEESINLPSVVVQARYALTDPKITVEIKSKATNG